MATKTHNLSIKTGTYQDRTTGKEKGRYLNIGSLFSHDDGGISLKLDCVPVGLKDWEGWVSAYPVDRDSTHAPVAAASQNNFDDDLPPFV